ncbi:hypothetical protein O1L60_24450 [Streptomyces diastatochromogenes]|nr:hypothetical protein [Streptomyces diastatochromogenes]
MSRYEDKEAAVRRLLDTRTRRSPRPRAAGRRARHPAAPPGPPGAAGVMGPGALAVLAFVVWASMTRPWEVPPAGTTPPLDGL